MVSIGEVYQIGYAKEKQNFVVIGRNDKEEEATLMNAYGYIICVAEYSLNEPKAYLPHFKEGLEALRNM